MKKSFPFFLIIAALFTPVSAFAASPSVSITAPTQVVHAGDTILIPVILSVPDQIGINVFKARVTVSGTAHLVSVATGGSIFTLWPEVSVVGDTTQFTGGTPGSVYGSHLRAVALVITTTGVGKVNVNVTSAIAYSGDGKGTAQLLNDSGMSFTVGSGTTSSRNELTDLLVKDSTPPNPFVITLGRDPSIYDNAYFISFMTSDDVSGVSHYEVSENKEPWILATSSYILSDQSLAGSVTVRAVDVAGNVRTEVLNFKSNKLSELIWMGIALFIVILSAYFFLRRRHNMRY